MTGIPCSVLNLPNYSISPAQFWIFPTTQYPLISSESLDDKESVSDITLEDDGVLGALSGRGPQSNGIHGAFSFTPGNLGFGHTGKTSSGKDAHMAYLMLRHIKLRHQRRVVSSNIAVKLVFPHDILHALNTWITECVCSFITFPMTSRLALGGLSSVARSRITAL